LQSKVRSGGEEMAVVGPNFMEPGIEGGYDVDGVARAKKDAGWQCTRQEFNTTQYEVTHRHQNPRLGRYILQECVANLGGRFPLERTLPDVAVKHAGYFGD
jgi:hypothetical protein